MAKIKNPLVSAIITTYNSAKTLEDLLISLKNQSYKKIEIIVVDNKSKDKTSSISKKYTKLVYQRGPERSAQRNYGFEKSKGKYVFFLDSDMIITSKVIEECVSLFEKKKGKIGGIIIPEESFGQGVWAEAKKFEREINQGEDYFEAARFFSKDIIREVGGYNENLTGPEDWELPLRIKRKYSIKRIKSGILHNEGQLSLQTLARKKYYYGLSVHKFLVSQKIPVLSARTVYFLRPGFYKNAPKLIKHPILTILMIVMLISETFAGGLGYLKGRFAKND